MPRPRRSYGRPGTKVFPTRWAAEHGDVIASTYESMVRIGPLGVPVRGEDGRTRTPPGVMVYSGAASITPSADGAVAASVVDTPASTRTYEVKLPAEVAGIDTDHHLLWVEESPDPDLEGARLTIQSVERGDRRFSRVLQTTLTD